MMPDICFLIFAHICCIHKNVGTRTWSHTTHTYISHTYMIMVIVKLCIIFRYISVYHFIIAQTIPSLFWNVIRLDIMSLLRGSHVNVYCKSTNLRSLQWNSFKIGVHFKKTIHENFLKTCLFYESVCILSTDFTAR